MATTAQPVIGYDGKWVRHGHFCPTFIKATVLPCLCMKDTADRISWGTGGKLALAYGVLLPIGYLCVMVFVYFFVMWFCLLDNIMDIGFGCLTFEKNWWTDGGDLIALWVLGVLVVGLDLIFLPRIFWWFKMPKVLHITDGACCNIIRLMLHMWLWGYPLAQDVETSKKMVGQPYQGMEAAKAKAAV